MSKYFIMNKDNPVASFDFVLTDLSIYVVRNIKAIDTLPFGQTVNTLSNWISSRFAAKHRTHLSDYLKSIGCCTTKGFIDLTYGLSIVDTFWIKPEDSLLVWNDVSLYRNDFDEVVQHLAFDGTGLYGKQMSTTSPEFGTNGNFDKCWVRENNKIYMLKRGTSWASNGGLEPYCEVLASQVFYKMHAGILYDLVQFRGYAASKCELFTSEDYQYVPISAFPLVSKELPDVLDFYNKTLGSDEALRKMLICDAITLNTDRHLGNFGFLCNTETNEIVKAAPGFDYNLSMMPYIVNDEFMNLDAVISKFTPCLGGDFIRTSKALLTSEIREDLLKLQGIELQLDCDDNFTESRLHYMTDIVNQRIDKILYNRVESYAPLKVEGISNLYKYRLQNGFTDDEKWYREEQPRLFKAFGCKHLDELEQEIVVLLKD